MLLIESELLLESESIKLLESEGIKFLESELELGSSKLMESESMKLLESESIKFLESELVIESSIVAIELIKMLEIKLEEAKAKKTMTLGLVMAEAG